MLPAAEDVSESEPPLFIGLERVFKLFVFVFIDVVPFIGVMLPGLLGVVMPALEALPLTGLVLRGTKSVGDTVDEDELSDRPETSSRAPGTVVLWLFGFWLKSPIP
ncbi:MAG TPA: hypothetical protein VH592_16950 [Gemmataceae bacterium]